MSINIANSASDDSSKDLKCRINDFAKIVMKSLQNPSSLKQEDITEYEQTVSAFREELGDKITSATAWQVLDSISKGLEMAKESTSSVNYKSIQPSSSSSSPLFAWVKKPLTSLFKSSVMSSLEISSPTMDGCAERKELVDSKAKVRCLLERVMKLSSDEMEEQYASISKEFAVVLASLHDLENTSEKPFLIGSLNVIGDKFSNTARQKLMMMMLIKPIEEKVGVEGIFRQSGSKLVVDAIEAAFQKG